MEVTGSEYLSPRSNISTHGMVHRTVAVINLDLVYRSGKIYAYPMTIVLHQRQRRKEKIARFV